MQCQPQAHDVADLLLEYCARKLDAGKAATVEIHLRMCESCQELVKAQRAVYESLDVWNGIEASPDFNRRMYARIEAEDRRSHLSRWASMLAARWSPFSWRPAMTFAAACAMLAAALCIRGPLHHQNVVQEPQAKIERVDVEQVERTLQDLDMLKQLNPAVGPEANSSGSI